MPACGRARRADALSRKLPGELETILAHCLAHARRQFVDVYDRSPEACRYLLEALAVVYHNDASARQRQLSPEARLQWHQESSGPTMLQLHTWLTRQLDERLTEPNSALGSAIGYMLKHWQRLTLFLRQAGAPLDNNLCERALRRNSLLRRRTDAPGLSNGKCPCSDDPSYRFATRSTPLQMTGAAHGSSV